MNLARVPARISVPIAPPPRPGTIVGTSITIAALVVWFVLLRPQAFWGPAGYVLVDGTSMLPTIRPGALVVTQSHTEYDIGSIVAYRVPEGDPAAGHLVIHRIVGGDATSGYVMKGDNAELTDVWRPGQGDVAGELWIIVPDIAPLVRFAMSPIMLSSAAAGVAAYLAFGALRPVRPPSASGSTIAD